MCLGVKPRRVEWTGDELTIDGEPTGRKLDDEPTWTKRGRR
jgi:hypothetical protein